MRRFVSIVLGVALLSSGALPAQDPVLTKVTGVVKNVDLKVGTITLNRKDAASDETFNLLKKDIEVIAPEGRKVQPDAVKPGQTVQLKVGLTGDVVAVLIQASVFLATVAEVDLARRTIAIAGEEQPATMMAVDAAAKILLAKRPAYLREVKPGSQMTVTPSLDGRTALALTLVSDPDGKYAAKLFPRVRASRLPGSRWVGTLTAVDAGKREIQFVGPKTKNLPRTVPVAKDAVIWSLHGQVTVQEPALSQVMAPAQATVLISPQNQVTHILIKPPAVEGKVKALDAERGQLTVELDGAARTLALPRHVKVMDKNRVRRLPELHPELTVSLVLSLDRQQLLGIDIGQAARTP
jgi:hypothetical protein